MTGYLSITTVKGYKYYRLVKSQRIDGHVKHVILKNWGSHQPTDSEIAEAKLIAALEKKARAKKTPNLLFWSDELHKRKIVKKRFEGQDYAYYTYWKSQRPKDSSISIKDWDDVPTYGDKVEIVHKYRYSCKVRHKSYESILLYINLSPTPLDDVSSTIDSK